MNTTLKLIAANNQNSNAGKTKNTMNERINTIRTIISMYKKELKQLNIQISDQHE